MEFCRCYGCMRELSAPGIVCPHCGYDNTEDPKKQPEHMLGCGTVLNNKYVLGRALGHGGFGVTYIGWDKALDIRICIKEYFPEGAAVRNNTYSSTVSWIENEKGDKLKKGRESFAREAHKAARLRDLPSVVKVWDVFECNDTAYIVMDFIEGVTLKNYLLERGAPLTEGECFRLLYPVMIDLEEVHRRDIIHRDISTDNLMVRSDGTIVLLDLGAAKDLSRNKAQSSFLVAKKGFSPMEQYMQNGLIGAWTDVYALCATMVCCVTGNLIPEPLERFGGSKIDLSAFSPAFAEVLERGLIIEPESRIQSVGELRRLLEQVCDDMPATVSAAELKPRPKPEVQRIPDSEYATETVAVTAAEAESKRDGKSKARLLVPAAAAVLLTAGGLVYALRGGTGGDVSVSREQTVVSSTIPISDKADESLKESSGQIPAEIRSSPEPTPVPTPAPTPTPEQTPEPTPEPLAAILAHPMGQQLIEGESCTLVVLASSPDSGVLSYQWFSGASDQFRDARPISGATSPSLTISPKEGQSYYWAAIWNSKGGKYSEAVYSEPAEVLVVAPTPAPTPAPPPEPMPTPLTEAEAEALFQTGRRQEEQRDFVGAFASYETAALAGNADAMARIGMMYCNGTGVSRDAKTGEAWLEKAVDAGNTEAACQLAKNAYSAGNYERALSMYLTAAEQGDLSAVYELALMYYNGVGVAKDYEKAMTWFTKAAEDGNGHAFYYIGNMYYYGQGVEADAAKAALCWQQAEKLLGQTLILPTA